MINVSPELLASKLSKDKSLDVRMLQKWALRSCADRLVSGGFKFRRSGFRGCGAKFINSFFSYLSLLCLY